MIHVAESPALLYGHGHGAGAEMQMRFLYQAQGHA